MRRSELKRSEGRRLAGVVLVALSLCACGPKDEHASNNIKYANNVNGATNAQNASTNSTTNNVTTPTNSGSNGGTGYGEYALALDEDCEGIAGLNGSALLAAMTDTVTVTMADLDDAGMQVNPRELTIGLTWPADPNAVCYPEYQETINTIPPRLGIGRLTITFSTPDGAFDETAGGVAWLSTSQGAVGSPSVLGAIPSGDLAGTYTFPTSVTFPNPVLTLFTTLSGGVGPAGNIAASGETSVFHTYGSFTGRQIVASWPYTP